jgi:membrane protein DedA with SNARE-associated domain
MPNALTLYIAAFISPFVQEDAAIIGAVTAFLHPETQNMASGPLVLASMFVGLVISDLWKYGIGWAARTKGLGGKLATNRLVEQLSSKIVTHPGKTLMFARFVPGTRIPAYIAAGYFDVPFGRFAFWIIVSGLAYIGVAIATLHTVGVVAGKTGQLVLAAAMVTGLLIFALRGMWRRKTATS